MAERETDRQRQGQPLTLTLLYMQYGQADNKTEKQIQTRKDRQTVRQIHRQRDQEHRHTDRQTSDLVPTTIRQNFYFCCIVIFLHSNYIYNGIASCLQFSQLLARNHQRHLLALLHRNHPHQRYNRTQSTSKSLPLATVCPSLVKVFLIGHLGFAQSYARA